MKNTFFINDEIRMTNDETNPNSEFQMTEPAATISRHWCFDIPSTFDIRASSFRDGENKTGDADRSRVSR
jgi:hypothetical protein